MATGRKIVAPGQPISSSSWGNLAWDQSVQCFASAADRDNQYPAGQRHPGAVVYLEDVKQFLGWDGTVWRPLGVAAAIRLRQNADQAFSALVETGLGLVLDYNTDATIFTAPGGGIVRINRTGVYSMVGNMSGAGGRFTLSIRIGTRVLAGIVGASDYNVTSCSTIERITAVPADYNASAFGFTAGTIKADAGNMNTSLVVARIGEA